MEPDLVAGHRVGSAGLGHDTAFASSDAEGTEATEGDLYVVNREARRLGDGAASFPWYGGGDTSALPAMTAREHVRVRRCGYTSTQPLGVLPGNTSSQVETLTFPLQLPQDVSAPRRADRIPGVSY